MNGGDGVAVGCASSCIPVNPSSCNIFIFGSRGSHLWFLQLINMPEMHCVAMIALFTFLLVDQHLGLAHPVLQL